MSLLGDLVVKLQADVSSYLTGMSSAQASVRNFSAAVRQSAQNVVNSSKLMGDSINSFGKNSSRSFKDVSRIAQGILVAQTFYKVTSSIESAANALEQFSLGMEEAEASFALLLADAPKAERLTNAVEDFAARTPFMIEQAMTNTRKLLAYGFDPSNIMALSNTLADAAAAAGDTNAYNRIGKALGQIRTKGKLAAQEMLQLTEAGIPAFEILRKNLGLTSDQLAEIGKQAIPADIAINALLKGMQERYGGAAKAMGDTTRGMLNTIKDNMLIIGGEAFEPFFASFKSLVTRFRDQTDRLRSIARDGGIGAVMRAIIPASVLPQIQLFIANIRSLVQAVGRLFISWGPIWQAVGNVVLGVINAILPVITLLTNVIAWLSSAFTSSSPRVRAFVGAIASLLITNSVIWVMLNFVAVLRKLFIVQALIGLVTGLAKAIRFLSAAMITNPWVALVGVAAGALLYLGLTSQKVSGWLTGLGNSFNKAFNNDPSKVFAPKMKENNAQAGEFNQHLVVSKESLDKLGDSAKKAGKKAKDMLAAFDEVYTITQKIDETGGIDAGAVSDVGDITTPPIPPVKIPEPEYPETEKPMQSWIDNFTKLLKDKFKKALLGAGIGALLGALIGGLIGGPQGALIGAGIGALAGGIAGLLWDSLPKSMKDAIKGAGIGAAIGALIGGLIGGPVGAAIGAGVGALAGGIAGYFWDSLPDKMKDATVGAGIGVAIGGVIGAIMGGPAGAAIGAGLGALTGGIVGYFWDDMVNFFSSDTGQGATLGSVIGLLFGSMVGGPVGAIIGTGIGTLAGGIVGSFWDQITAAFSTSGGQGAAIGAIVGTAIGGPIGSVVGAMLGENYQAIATWASNTLDMVDQWSADTGTSIGNWVTNTSARFVTWVTQTVASMGAWADNAMKVVGQWVVSSSKSFDDWVAGTFAKLGSWADSTIETFTNWSALNSKSFQQWFDNSSKGVSDWAATTFKGFADWLQRTVEGFAHWQTTCTKSIGQWIATTFKGLADWLNGTHNGFSKWWTNTTKGFTDWAKNLAESVGHYMDVLAARIHNAIEAMKFWKSNKDYIDVGAIPKRSGSSLAGHARGGIFNKEHIARFAEGNKPEAIIPLQNANAMQPFVDAVAAGLQQSLVSALPQITTPGTQPVEQTSPPLYVGTLIADDRGIKELERRMRIVTIQENQRRGIL